MSRAQRPYQSSKPTMNILLSGTRCWRITASDKRHPFPSTILHRLDGPAVEHPDGSKEWWVRGKRHRHSEPAVEHGDGFGREWWVRGVFLTRDLFTRQDEWTPPTKSSLDALRAWKRHR